MKKDNVNHAIGILLENELVLMSYMINLNFCYNFLVFPGFETLSS